MNAVKLSKKIFFSFLFFSFLFVVSCTKQDTSPTSTGEYDNPYKGIGVLHNAILGAVIIGDGNNTRALSQLKTPEEIVQAFKRAAEKLNTSNMREDEIPDSISIAYVKSILQDPNLDNMSNFLTENGLISENVHSKYLDFKSRMLTAQGTDTSYNNLYNTIVAFEWEVVSDSKLSDSDRVTLLKLTAIEKESFKFWYANKGLLVNHTNSRSTFLKFLVVALADAASFPSGVFSGIVSGAFYVAVNS